MSVQGPQQVLELAKVSRTFGEGATAVAALREVDLSISAGEFVAVMGPSGSGKSSLLALAGGLDRPTSGDVFVESTPLGGLGLNDLARLRRRAVGYVFQDFNLVPTLTAAENVALPLELDGSAHPEGATPGVGCAAAGGNPGTRGPLYGPDVRRPAAAGGHCAGHRGRPPADPGRRTYGSPGFHHRPRRHGSAPCTCRCRCGRDAGDP